MRIRPIFAWYDFWVGFFVDRVKKKLYFFPLPCLGIVIEWGRRRGLKAYDPKNVVVTFNGVPLKGFIEGTMPDESDDQREWRMDGNP